MLAIHMERLFRPVRPGYPGHGSHRGFYRPRSWHLIRYHRALLVHPLFWTSKHLEIFGYSFQPIQNATPTEDTGGEQRPSKSKAQPLPRSSWSGATILKDIQSILLSEASIYDEYW